MNRAEEVVMRMSVLSQKKPPSAETENILRILSNCINEVEIAVNLPAILQLHTLPGGDDQLRSPLKTHFMFCGNMEEEEHLDQQGNSKKTRVANDVKNSVRDVVRLIRTRPQTTDAWKTKVIDEIGENEQKLIRCLQMFHSQTMVKMMNLKLQLPAEKQESPPKTTHLISQQKEVAAVLKEINARIDQKTKDIEALEKVLKENVGREKVGQVPAVVPVDQNKLVPVDQNKLVPVDQNKLVGIKREMDQLNIQLYNLMVEHRQTERSVQEQNEKVEKEIEELHQNFNHEIKETNAKLELNEEELQRLEEEMMELKEPFQLLEEECDQILELRRQQEEKRREEVKELELKTKAAILAQAWWRGHRTRNALKNKNRSKKSQKIKGRKEK